jgi:hypothetical protein
MQKNISGMLRLRNVQISDSTFAKIAGIMVNVRSSVEVVAWPHSGDRAARHPG